MGLLTAVGIGYLSRRGQVKEDTAIGVIFAASFALGVALLSTVRSYSVDLTHILFGNVLGVSNADLWLTAGLGGGGPAGRLPALQRAAGHLLRSDPGRHPPPATERLGLSAVGPHRPDHRRLVADSGRGADGGHAGHAGRHSLPAHPPPVAHDDRRRGHRRCLLGYRSVPFLLCQCGLGAGRGPGLHGLFCPSLPLCPSRGLLWTWLGKRRERKDS